METGVTAQNGQPTATVFSTALGWMALVLDENVIQKLTIGCADADAARAALAPGVADNPCIDLFADRLIERLRAYADGRRVDFDNFQVDTRAMTDFGRRVTTECRKIPYGKTLTYGQLAAKAGSPGAARAVGNRMAGNRVPIIVPCHRVLPSVGGLGGFSASGGVELKRRLLEMEAAGCVSAFPG